MLPRRLPVVLCAVLVILLGNHAQADGLETRLAALDSVSGSFRQQLVSSTGDVLEESRGTLKLLRPGYLAWHIQTPEEQLLIAAGGSLWHYDVELETVTRRHLAADTPGSPLAILGGDAATLEQHYRIEKTGDQTWHLFPRIEGADFTRVELTFAESLPTRMVIRDALERATVIDFESLQSDTDLGPADFEFVPPPGVDFYEHES
jgi:outer membrane lipoprotein carrier protein